MKSQLVSAAALTLLLSACGKEAPPPVQPPVTPAPVAPATPQAVEPAVPSGAMTDEDKKRQMEAAVEEAKKAARKGE